MAFDRQTDRFNHVLLLFLRLKYIARWLKHLWNQILWYYPTISSCYFWGYSTIYDIISHDIPWYPMLHHIALLYRMFFSLFYMECIPCFVGELVTKTSNNSPLITNVLTVKPSFWSHFSVRNHRPAGHPPHPGPKAYPARHRGIRGNPMNELTPKQEKTPTQ